MGDDTDRPRVAAAGPTDGPETGDRYVEAFVGTGDSGTVTLAGVVHDHPASVSRVRRVVRAAEPDVLALELPPLAVPLYEAHATEGETPPALGGEFSAAVQAATTDDIVGIDGPSQRFIRMYLGRLASERVPLTTVGRSLRSLLSASGTAIACRIAAWFTRRTPLRVGVGSPTPHETSWVDPPGERDADESREIQSAITVRETLEPPPSVRYCSGTRERYMADRLSTVRERGEVVAIVGAGHFSPLSEELDSAQTPE